MALISMAHPNFRAQLLQDAIEARYLPPGHGRVGDKIHHRPPRRRCDHLLLKDGTQITFRSIHPTDEPRMRDLVYDLSQETIFYRFMSHHQRFGQRQIQNFVYVDHRKDVAIVGTIPEAHGEDIIAVGRYYLDEKTNRAEVAFVVRDDWQNKRIGTFLFQHLTDLAMAQRHRRLHRRGPARQHPHADDLQPQRPQGPDPAGGRGLQLRHRLLTH